MIPALAPGQRAGGLWYREPLHPGSVRLGGCRTTETGQGAGAPSSLHDRRTATNAYLSGNLCDKQEPSAHGPKLVNGTDSLGTRHGPGPTPARRASEGRPVRARPAPGPSPARRASEGRPVRARPAPGPRPARRASEGRPVRTCPSDASARIVISRTCHVRGFRGIRSIRGTLTVIRVATSFRVARSMAVLRSEIELESLPPPVGRLGWVRLLDSEVRRAMLRRRNLATCCEGIMKIGFVLSNSPLGESLLRRFDHASLGLSINIVCKGIVKIGFVSLKPNRRGHYCGPGDGLDRAHKACSRGIRASMKTEREPRVRSHPTRWRLGG